MRTNQPSFLNGWRLTALISAALLAAAAAAVFMAPAPVDGARSVIRLTARTSVVLFLLAFTASSLWLLAPSAATRWLRQNRRYIGVSFAASHFIHAGAIIALWQLDYLVFVQLTNSVAFVAGGLAYLFIALMTLTSFDRPAALAGPRIWRWLHTAGAWYIWMSFALNFGKRVVISPVYWLPVSVVLLALLIRIAAFRRKPAVIQQAA
jgi:methionine sulfoxide reductase heme-binding subunit